MPEITRLLQVIMEWIQNNIGVLGIGTTFAFGFIAQLPHRRRNRKALSSKIVSDIPLLNPSLRSEEEVVGKLQVLFEDRSAQNGHLIKVRISNSGYIPIRSTDYDRAVNLGFGKQSQIIMADVAETEPDNLQASFSNDGTRMWLEPVLLNRKQSITLKMLVTQLDDRMSVKDQMSVDWHIVGVPTPGQVRKRTQIVRWVRSIASLSIASLSLVLFFKNIYVMLVWAAMILGMVLIKRFDRSIRFYRQSWFKFR